MKYNYNVIRDEDDERDFLASAVLNVHPSVKLPSSVDLRPLCPPVFDQGEEGSCTANAGCSNKSMVMKRIDLIFSRQFLYRKERELEGTVEQDSGVQMRTIVKALTKFGVCLEEFMPYTKDNLFGDPTADAIANALSYKKGSYRRVTTLDQIKQQLALKQLPVLMGMEVFEYMESEEMARTGILRMPGANEQDMGGHAVLIVGYIDKPTVRSLMARACAALPIIGSKINTTTGYLIVRNSWGDKWGQKGYFLVPYEYVIKGFAFDFWIYEE